MAGNQTMGHLQDPVTWYGINYTGTQMTQWDFQNKGKSGWTGTSSFVLEVPLRYLRPSVIYSVPCDWILQMAYCEQFMQLHIYTNRLLSFLLQGPLGAYNRRERRTGSKNNGIITSSCRRNHDENTTHKELCESYHTAGY